MRVRMPGVLIPQRHNLIPQVLSCYKHSKCSIQPLYTSDLRRRSLAISESGSYQCTRGSIRSISYL